MALHDCCAHKVMLQRQMIVVVLALVLVVSLLCFCHYPYHTHITFYVDRLLISLR